jgi:purine nucleosidase
MKQLILGLIWFLWAGNVAAQKPQVWLDADTGNEMDDLYAIVRLLK